MKNAETIITKSKGKMIASCFNAVHVPISKTGKLWIKHDDSKYFMVIMLNL